VGKKVILEAAARSETGKVRGNNEDNLCIDGELFSAIQLDEGVRFADAFNFPCVLGICDGMGGQDYGEFASAITAQAIAEFRDALCGDDSDAAIAEFVKTANSRICGEITATGKRIGTTGAVVIFKTDLVIAVNIGDSRIYCCRDGILSLISVDHTEAQMKINMGLMTPEQAETDSSRHRLTQYFGMFEDEMTLTPAVSKRPPELNDVYLICSDGLTDMIPDASIASIIGHSDTAAQIADNLVAAALAAGGGDNVTVAAAKIVETEDDRPLVKRLFSGRKTRLNPTTKHRSIFDFR